MEQQFYLGAGFIVYENGEAVVDAELFCTHTKGEAESSMIEMLKSKSAHMNEQQLTYQLIPVGTKMLEEKLSRLGETEDDSLEKLYAVIGIARQMEDDDYPNWQLSLNGAFACTKKEACNLFKDNLLKSFPPEAGWDSHEARADSFPASLIRSYFEERKFHAVDTFDIPAPARAQ
jgi:hypothetical protein